MQDLTQLQISQETVASVLQLSGQYALPAAALLRATYAGSQGKLPEGMTQIVAASVFAGLTALADNQQASLPQMVADLAGNTVFVAGLLSLVVLYLIRIPYFGLLVDAVVGGLVALAAWTIWVYVLGNTELRISDIPLSLLGAQDNASLVLAADLATLPVIFVGGAVAFVLLRFALRQARRVLAVARIFITLGVLLILAAGGLFLMQQMGMGSLPISIR